MIKRSLVAACLSAAVVTGSVLVAQQAAARPARGPKVTRVNVAPRRVAAHGGTVTVTAIVKTNGALVSAVNARVQMKGQRELGSPTTLSSTSRAGVYEGVVAIPANSSTRPAQAFIFVDVVSDRGATRPQRKAVVNVDRGGRVDDSYPPPPPQ